MAQVVKTVNDVIVNALYLIGELGVGETPDAFMLTTGLDLLNEILDKFAASGIYVPYLTEIESNFIVGQDTYSIGNIFPADISANRLIDLSFANYRVPTDGGTQIVYPLKIINKATYYNIVRQTNLLTRPGFIFLNKQPLQSVLTVYPVPDQPYPFTIQAKLMLSNLTPQEPLYALPPNYYGFLKYAVARKFTAYYPSSNWSQQTESEYQDYYNMLRASNEDDLTITPSTLLSSKLGYFWPNILAYP